MVRSLFGNSNRKLTSTFWGSPFIPVGTNPMECCLPFTNSLGSLSVPDSRYTNSPPLWIQTVTDVALCGNLINRLPLCFRHPNRIFLSNGKHPSSLESHNESWKRKRELKIKWKKLRRINYNNNNIQYL